MHTCYVPGRRRRPRPGRSLGAAALAALDEHGLPDLGLDPALVDEVAAAGRAKLATEPVEDLRVDAEDGYAAARSTRTTTCSPRPRPLAADRRGRRRAAVGRDPRQVPRGADPRTAASGPWTSSSALLRGAGRRRRHAPKVTDVEQVRPSCPSGRAAAAHGVTLTSSCRSRRHRPSSGPDGTATVARMVHVAGPRLIGLHYGTYDYSAALGIAAAYQSSDHPAADFAKQVMQVAVGRHRRPRGRRLDQRAAGRPAGAGARRLAAARPAGAPGPGPRLLPGLGPAPGTAGHAVRGDLRVLPRRRCRAAVGPAAAYLDRTDGGVLDEPATARALAGVLLRGLDCGAVDEAEDRSAGGPGRAPSWISWQAGGQGDPEWSPIVARPAAAPPACPAREGPHDRAPRCRLPHRGGARVRPPGRRAGHGRPARGARPRRASASAPRSSRCATCCRRPSPTARAIPFVVVVPAPAGRPGARVGAHGRWPGFTTMDDDDLARRRFLPSGENRSTSQVAWRPPVSRISPGWTRLRRSWA